MKKTVAGKKNVRTIRRLFTTNSAAFEAIVRQQAAERAVRFCSFPGDWK